MEYDPNEDLLNTDWLERLISKYRLSDDISSALGCSFNVMLEDISCEVKMFKSIKSTTHYFHSKIVSNLHLFPILPV